MIDYLLFALLGFLSGGVMYSYWIPLRVKGVDVVSASSDGNAGVWNAAQLAGLPVASLCLVCDAAKGALPVLIAWHFVDPLSLLFAIVCCAPVIGHIVSPYARRLSGKGITTMFGVLVGLIPLPGSWAFLVLGAIYLMGLLVIKVEPHELLSIYTCGLFSLVMGLSVMWGTPVSIAVSCVGVAACVALRANATTSRRRPSTRWSKKI